MKRVIVLFLLLMPYLLCALSVAASVNKTRIETSDRLQYTIRIKSDKAFNVSEPQAPHIDNFSFVNMTSSTRSSSSIVNFKTTRVHERSYTYIYVPLREGISTIPAQSVRVDNKVYTTKPITVTVIKSSTSPSQNNPAAPGSSGLLDPDFPWTASRMTGSTMLLALPQRQKVHKGEPTIISYYLYTDQMVRSFNLDDEEDFPGYGKSVYEQPSMLEYEVVNHQGKRFQRALIKRLVLSPNQTGELRAPELRGSARIYEFGYMNQPLRSQDAWLEVVPLPKEGVPQSFSGAVGSFELSEDISDGEIGLGEAITFSLRIAGRGNYNQFGNPVFPKSEAQVSSPMAVDKLNAGIEGSRVLYYTIIPAEKGIYSLPSLSFSWFDPEAGMYRSYNSKSREIKVKSSNVISYFSGLLDSNKQQTLRPMLSRSAYPDYPNYLQKAWYWLAVGFILLGLGLAMYLSFHRIKRTRDPESYARMMADKALKKYLQEAQNAAQQGSKDFYTLAENGLMRYLSTKLGIGMGLSTIEKLESMEGMNLSEGLIEDTKCFIASCERHRFSPQEANAKEILQDLQLLKLIVSGFCRNGGRR
ncbi:MAG: BatD family protein [Candidatus Cloacimonetes bacterium]|nr:BatD family protein [Candidatus Cloacimonadota bacterium]